LYSLAHALAADVDAGLRELVVDPARAATALELHEERPDELQKLAVAATWAEIS
jgi:hypothetical protein